MNPFFANIISQATKKTFGGKKIAVKRARVRDKLKSRQVRWRQLRDIFLLGAGIISATFGLKAFLLPSRFIDGGATGISLLLTETTSIPLSVYLILVNIPFILLGYNQISRIFTIKTIFTIIGLAISVELIDFEPLTHDKLLVAVFGGFFLGAGIGLAIRGGGVLDGTELLAIYISRRTSLSVGDVILIINIIIFSLATILLSKDIVLYAILTYLAASKTVDYIIEGIEEYTGVTIISTKSEEISDMITQKLQRGITIYKGSSGFGKRGFMTGETKIIFTVVTRLEVSRLQSEVETIDHNAFIVMHSIKDTKGGRIKKRALPH